jgi:hypothetical protein
MASPKGGARPAARLRSPLKLVSVFMASPAKACSLGNAFGRKGFIRPVSLSGSAS